MKIICVLHHDNLVIGEEYDASYIVSRDKYEIQVGYFPGYAMFDKKFFKTIDEVREDKIDYLLL